MSYEFSVDSPFVLKNCLKEFSDFYEFSVNGMLVLKDSVNVRRIFSNFEPKWEIS